MQQIIQMQIKFSSKSKGTSTPAALSNIEEIKMHSDEESSLLTEEDSSGFPLPPEIIEIKRKNKKLHRHLTTEIMNCNNSSESDLYFEESSGHLKLGTQDGDVNSKLNQTVSKNKDIKQVLAKILNLQSYLMEAKSQLEKNEYEIRLKESEYRELKRSLSKIQEEIENSKQIKSQCQCTLY